MAEAQKRIYIAVPVTAVDAEGKPRLVNAGTPAATRLHVTKNLYDIRVATPHEIAKHVGAGVKVEEAGVEGQANVPGTD